MVTKYVSRQSTLQHFYWAGLVLYVGHQYCAHSFARNWQLPFLNQQKGENDCRKYFMIKSRWKKAADPKGLNLQPPDHQLDAHPSEPPRLAITENLVYCTLEIIWKFYSFLSNKIQITAWSDENYWFVCVQVLRPSQPNEVMLNMVSFPNHTFTGQA